MRDRAAEASRWLRQAEHDLLFGELALREGFFAQACFVSQQTAEKALKSLSYGQGERLVLGHSIVELADRLAAKIPELGKLREQAGLLDQYYVATRYPNGLPGGVPFEAFGERQAREAIEAARTFVAIARRAANPSGPGGSRV
jgi:HEPN domain-containing protein